jgi:hypothetical protein
VLDHFLAVGGNEVVNTERSYGYLATADCAVDWLADPECGTIADVEQDEDYTFANIADAPWYDPDVSDVASRFYGLAGINILGLSDSTRSAVVTESNGDGATVSGYRHGSREVRVRAWMTALGTDALEYGMTWLRNVLEPNACGQHGGTCGEADAAFFVDCPPERRVETAYTNWVTEGVNLHPNPSVEAAVTVSQWANGNQGTGGVSTGTRVASIGRDGGYGFRKAWTTGESLASTFGEIFILGNSAATAAAASASTSYTASVWFRTNRAGTFFLRCYPMAGETALPEIAGPPQAVAANTWVRLTLSLTTDPTTTNFLFAVATNTLDQRPSGTTWDVDQFLLEQGLVLRDYYDGSFADSELTSYSWAGAANNSPSVWATRTSFQQPEGDSTYFPYVDTYRRFLHAVRCISGPFVVQEAVSSDKRHVGRLVEFTLLSEVPYVYGTPKEIDVPPIVPTIVQDIAYNLAPYPSAELPGAAVVVATNLCVNPSLEADATGWSFTIAPSSSPDPTSMITGGRSNDIAAAGTWSYRVRLDASTYANDWGGVAQVAVKTASASLAGLAAGTRLSFSVWAALVVLAGPNSSPFNISAKAVFVGGSGGTVFLEGGGDPSGSALSAKSAVIPAGATSVYLEVTYDMNWLSASPGNWVANDIRMYADAAAVTVP